MLRISHLRGPMGSGKTYQGLGLGGSGLLTKLLIVQGFILNIYDFLTTNMFLELLRPY